MWELDHREDWARKNWCFWTVVLEKTLESPLDCKEIKPVNPKQINPEYSLEGLMLKLKLQYFGNLMRKADSLEKTVMLGKIEGRRRRGWQRTRRLDSITDSMDLSVNGLQEMVKNREAWHSPWSHKDSDMTEWLNNNNSGPSGKLLFVLQDWDQWSPAESKVSDSSPRKVEKLFLYLPTLIGSCVFNIPVVKQYLIYVFNIFWSS